MGKNLKGKELGRGLYQRKDGRYEAKAMISGRKIDLYDWDLKRLKKRFTDEKAKMETEFDYVHKEYTLNQWFYEWFELYKKPCVKENSAIHMVRLYERMFGKKIGDRKLNSIRNVDIQFEINEFQRIGRAASTVKDALGLLTACMEAARLNGIILTNPCFDIKVSWRAKSIPREALSREEQRILLKKADESWYREFIYTLFLTGLRMSEISGLKWEDIDWKNRCIRVNRALRYDYVEGTKTIHFTSLKTINSYRKIPFIEGVEEILKSQKEKIDLLKQKLGDRFRCKAEFSDLVFMTSMGSPVSRYSAETQIKMLVKEANIEEEQNAERENREPVVIGNVSPHIIRHTFATRCFEHNMNPKVVQHIMGHAHYSTTIDIYTHIVENHEANIDILV